MRFKRVTASLIWLAIGMVGGASHAQAGVLNTTLDSIQDEVVSGLIPNEYIVSLRKPAEGHPLAGLAVREVAESLLVSVGGGQILSVYEQVLRGFAVTLSPVQAELLSSLPLVERIEPNRVIQGLATQTDPAWGLDRVDQRDLPLDAAYSAPDNAGQGAHVYIIDSGLNRDHQDFAGRIGESRNFVAPYLRTADPDNWDDCNGHGTHVAGTAAGTEYGLAKQATVHAIRVLNCQNSGNTIEFMAAVDWLLANHESPAVANISIGTVNGRTTFLEDAVRELVEAGIAVSVAAGNSTKDACNTSPAAEPTVLTVGASDSSDARSSFSNYGACLDLFAPGSDIVSASHTSDSDSETMSGTSMAAPHVAGALALLRAQYPNQNALQIQDLLLADASTGQISDSRGSPNRLLYVNNDGETVDFAPIASFSVECTALSCSFDASASSDDVAVAAYHWDFGDGSSADGVSVSYEYVEAGDYGVTLSVTDTINQTDQETQSIGVESEAGGPCTDCQHSSGSFGFFSSTAYAPSSDGFSSDGGEFFGQLSGPDNADYDLYLEKKSGGFWASWQIVARSENDDAQEQISYSGGAGTYRWRIKSNSGSGSYDFYYRNP